MKFLSDEWAKALTEGCNANRQFTKASKGQDAVFLVRLTDSPQAGSFSMTWRGGLVEFVTNPADPAPDVTLDLDYPTMVELSKGTVNGPLAVATGRMKAEGNMEKMFGLGKALDLLPVVESGMGIEY
jgi:putative sterol carrier protein